MNKKCEVNGIVNILVVKAEDVLLQEVIAFLSDKAKYQVLDVSLDTCFANILVFPGIEIYIKE